MKSKNSEDLVEVGITTIVPYVNKFKVQKKKGSYKVHEQRKLSDFKKIFNLLLENYMDMAKVFYSEESVDTSLGRLKMD